MYLNRMGSIPKRIKLPIYFFFFFFKKTSSYHGSSVINKNVKMKKMKKKSFVCPKITGVKLT